MPPKTKRDQGQWALGSRTPLNPNEEFKAADDGLNVRQRILDTYSIEGFDSIPAEDLRGRMRWWGLYTQRRPGIPGGRTASLPPEELEDKYFMMRVRSDGGALSSAQARVIGGISTGVRPPERRHLRPAEHPVALDPDRGRAGDLAAAGSCRPGQHGGLRGCAPSSAGLTGSRGCRRRDHGWHPRHQRDRPALRGQPRVLQLAPQVQECGVRLPASGRRPRDQRRLLHRRGPPGARPRLRPMGWRGTVDQPETGGPARRLGADWPRCQMSTKASSRSSATTAIDGCGTRPD